MQMKRRAYTVQRRLSTCSDGSDLDFVSFYVPPHHSLLLLLFFIIIIFFLSRVFYFRLYSVVGLCVGHVFHSFYLCDTVNASPLTFRLFIIRQCHLLDDMVYRVFFSCMHSRRRRRSTAMLAHARSPPLCC